MMGGERFLLMPFVVTLADWAIQLLILLIIAASLLSFFRPDPRNLLVRGLHAVVDPVLHPIRSILPPAMGLDFSPMVALVILWILQNLLRSNLAS
jgi:YggT family protein